MPSLNDRRPLTKEQVRMLARLRTFHRRYKLAVDKLGAMEDQRLAMYVEARSIEPPLTFREIAGVFEVTEAAIMQKLSRERK